MRLCNLRSANDAGITTGTKGIGLQIAADCYIERVDVFSDIAGSISIDIWKSDPDNYPPTDAGSIAAGSPVTLTNEQANVNESLSAWDVELARGDILFYNVDSVSGGIRLVTVILHVVRYSAFTVDAT